MYSSRIVAVAKRLGAVGLALVIFWHVAQHAGLQRRGTAIVHVAQLNVVIAIDGQVYPVDSMAETPLVCELGPGEHVLAMSRGGRLVYQESFTIEPGGELILSAYDPRSVAPAVGSPEPNLRMLDLAGLASLIARFEPMQH